MAELTMLQAEAHELDDQLSQLVQTKAQLERTIAAQDDELRDLQQRQGGKATREKLEAVDGLREELATTARQVELMRDRRRVVQEEIALREKKKERPRAIVYRCQFCGTILPPGAHLWPTASGCTDYCRKVGLGETYRSIKVNAPRKG